MRYAEYVLVIARKPEDECTTHTHDYFVSEIVRVPNGGCMEAVKEREGDESLKFILIEPSNWGPTNSSVSFVARGQHRWPAIGIGELMLFGTQIVRDVCTIIPVLLEGDAERGVWREYLAKRKAERDIAVEGFDYAAEERAHRAMMDIGYGNEGYEDAWHRWCLLHDRKRRIERDAEQVERFEDIEPVNLCLDETNTANAGVYFDQEHWDEARAAMKAEGLSSDQV